MVPEVSDQSVCLPFSCNTQTKYYFLPVRLSDIASLFKLVPKREKNDCLQTTEAQIYLPSTTLNPEPTVQSFHVCFFYMNTTIALIMRNNWENVGNTQTKGFFLDSCDLGRWVCSQSKHSSLSCKFCENSPQEDRNVLQLIQCCCNSSPSKEQRPSGFSLSFSLRTTWGSAV